MGSFELRQGSVYLQRRVTAARYDKLFQTVDDHEVRTLYCRDNFIPPLEFLRYLDLDIQFRVVLHGIVRIWSFVDTDTLVDRMREINGGSAKIPGFRLAPLSPFQLVTDVAGPRWVSSPLFPPVKDSLARGLEFLLSKSLYLFELCCG